MQIHYLWIEKYRNLSNQAFNLTGRYTFDLRDERTDLCIEPAAQYLKGFWQYPNLESVSAIVGENGSGKTNLLDFIRYTFPQGERLPDAKDKRFLAAVEKDGRFIVFYNHLAGEGLRISAPQDGPEWHPEFVKYGMRPGTAFGDMFQDTSFIFYSNEFAPGARSGEENAAEGEPVHGVHNISTRFTSLHDAVKLTNDPQTTANRIIAHGVMEINRNLDFLSQDGAQARLPFRLPAHLGLRPLRFTNEMVFDSERKNVPRIQTVVQGDGKQAYINSLSLAMLINYARDSRKTSLLAPFQEAGWHLQHQAVDLVREAFRRPGLSCEKSPKLRCELLSLIEREVPDSEYDQMGTLMRFPTRQGVTQLLNRLLSLYTESVMITPYLDAFWSHRLSSGEQSLLTLYSRFWSITGGRTARNNQVSNPAIVLIDEGDIYFHPAWQRELVARLLQFLAREAFPEFALQVILTSNSPFCLSDIPKSNVVFIKRDGETGAGTVLPASNRQRETLAANIHDLLGDSFFMNYSLIGEFARERIQELTTWLKSRPPLDNDRSWLTTDTADSLIDQIGEPLLRQRLREMYIEKAQLSEDPELLDRFILRRTKELKELRERRSEMNHQDRRRND